MEDPVLNRNLEEIKELHTRWTQFRDFVLTAVKSRRATPQAEMKFLELKSRIAMLQDSFMATLEHSHKTGQNIMTIVGDCILLQRVANYNDAERQKFEFDWNECYILLTEQIAHLEEEKQRLAGISEAAFKARRRKERIVAAVYNFIHSAGLKWTIVAAIIVLIVYVIPTYFYSYSAFHSMPVIKMVSLPIANYVYRPFLARDYEYRSMDWVERNKGYVTNEIFPDARASGASDLTPEFFKMNVPRSLGIQPADVPQAIELFDRHIAMEVERFLTAGIDMQFYYILFASSDDAKAFIDLARKGLDSLPQATRDAILNSTHVRRRANFVAIGIGSHALMLNGHIWRKFKFKEQQRSILEPQ